MSVCKIEASASFFFRKNRKDYYEKQLAQMEERPTGLKSRTIVDEDAEIEHNPHCFFFLRKNCMVYNENNTERSIKND